MAPNGRDTLLSVAQAAALLGVHPNTIRSWTDAGRLAAYRINARGDRRFRRDDVERILVEDARASETDQPADRVERAAELATFERVAAGLAATPTPASVARALVGALRTEMHVARVAVYARVEDVFELMAHAGFDEPPSGSRTLDVAPDAGSDNHEIPLATRKGTLGILIVDAPSADRMSPAFVRAVSMTVATALASARLVVHARQELGRVRALRSVTKELTGTLDLERVLDDIIERTRTLFAADRAGIWLLDGTPHPVALVTRGLSDEFLAHSAALTVSSDTISIPAQREGRTRWMRNADRDPSVGEMRDAYAAEGIRTVCLAPLLSRGTALGVIGLYHDSDRTWPDEEVDLAQAFADQAAIAVQNARLYRSVADQAARMRSIQDLSGRLNGLTDVRSIGEAIVAEARALAEYHDIRVYRVDWDRRVCEPIAFTREMIDEDLDDLVGRLRVEVGEGLTGWAAEHGEPLLVNDALEDERSKTIEGTEDVEESMLVVPMLYEGRALGVIVLSQLGFNRFSTDDLQTMTIFAGYAAQAMANAVSYEQMVSQAAELARRADSQRRLLEINERLLSTLDPSAVLETIAEGLQSVVSYDNLIICHLDREARVLRPVLARDAHVAEVMDHVMPLGQGLTSWAVEHHEPLLINDALSDPRALQIPGTPVDPEAIIIVPLIVDGEVVGAMNIGRLGLEEAHFSQTDFELVQLFAGQASIAMRNATEHHAMSQRAETDALTGLGNHGAFQQELARLVDGTASAATGKAGRLAVLMMDLDAFKGYNDRHGHPAGDALLHEVATAIYGAARSEDRVFRYGGDEFALILPGSTVAEAARASERIRTAVASLTPSTPNPVTITIGVAGLPGDAHERANLIEAADTALYYGKRAGGNRVVRSDELPRDVIDLRGRLDELASAALLDGDDPRAVEHLVQRATQLSGHRPKASEGVRDAVLAVTRSFGSNLDAAEDGGHADRVGRLATRIAERLGLSDEERHGLELAGRLHGLDDAAVAELSAIPSLHEVATLIIGHRGLLAEGARRGRRGPRARGPVGPHVIGVANAYDELVSDVGSARTGRSDAMTRLRRDPATFRSDVLRALAAVVNEHRDEGRRRRAVDRDAVARGAA